jgi:hypothetical protein
MIVEPRPIKIGDKDYIFHFNNYALSELAKVLDISILEAPAKMMEVIADDIFFSMAVIVHCGIVGYEKSKMNFGHGMKIADMVIAVGVMQMTELNSLLETFQDFKDSQGITAVLKEQAEKEAAKTDTLPKKKPSHSRTSTNTQPAKSA